MVHIFQNKILASWAILLASNDHDHRGPGKVEEDSSLAVYEKWWLLQRHCFLLNHGGCN